MAVSRNEFRWREWVLGEGEFKGKGARSKPRPELGFGAKGQKPVPPAWWGRMEEFVARREKGIEPKPKPPAKNDPVKHGSISVNFHVREFDCHDGRKVPRAAELALTRLAVQFLEPMRAKFGPGKVLSGYRHSAYNKRIGGATKSQHIYDDDTTTVAADLTFAKGTPAQWAAEARRISDKHGFGGVGEYVNSGFVHMDNRRFKARWSG